MKHEDCNDLVSIQCAHLYHTKDAILYQQLLRKDLKQMVISCKNKWNMRIAIITWFHFNVLIYITWKIPSSIPQRWEVFLHEGSRIWFTWQLTNLLWPLLGRTKTFNSCATAELCKTTQNIMSISSIFIFHRERSSSQVLKSNIRHMEINL